MTTAGKPTPRTVLVIDDDPAVLSVLALMLERTGCKVLSAASCDAAIDIARDNAVNLVVCDVNIPCSPGPLLVQQLRASGVEAPTLFVSGDPAPEHLDHALQLGGTSFLAKPFTLAELQDAIAAAVSGV